MDSSYFENRNSWLLKSIEDFVKDCRIEQYQASGPGGQKRNKKLSAVRVTHIPTGISAISENNRSVSVNKSDAIKKLRFMIAISARGECPDIDEFNISKNNSRYPLMVARIFDILHSKEFKLKEAALELGSSTAGLIKFISKDDRLWRAVNRERDNLGLKILKK